MMKLSKREKIMLVSLGALILIVVYLQFSLAPQLRRISELEVELEEYTSKVNRVKIDVSPKNKIHREFKVLNSKAEMATDNLFPSLIQEKFITILDDMSKKSELDTESMTFTKEEVESIEVSREKNDNNYYLKDLVKDFHNETEKTNKSLDEEEKNEKVKKQEEEEKKTQLEKMSTTITFSGEYENIMNFIKNIEGFDNRIAINTIGLHARDDNSMTGNIILDFYALPKLNSKDEDYLNWDIENEYGRENPFEAFSGYVESSNNSNGGSRRRNYDFFMTVKPITSDLPTVIMGKSKDTSMKTYVFADNNGVENVELQIHKDGKKYYYKYKTQSESYPKNYETERIEFKPVGRNIEFNINTYKRNNAKDTSGVNLTLINKSDLTLNVRINHEDKYRPRVKIAKKSGNVLIKRSLEE